MRSVILFVALILLTLSGSDASAQLPKGKAKVKEPEVMDITQQVGASADPRNPKYFKISGPFGQSYFVVGDDVGLKSASITSGEKVENPNTKKEETRNITRIEMRVVEDGRGIQFIGMAGAQVEFLPDGTKKGQAPEVTVIRMNNQTVDLDKGTATIVLGRPVPPMPKADPKNPPKKGGKN